MIANYFPASQIAWRVLLPILFCAFVFKWSEYADPARSWWIHPVFGARLLSSTFFCIVVFALPKAPDDINYLNMDASTLPVTVAVAMICSGLTILISRKVSQQPAHLKVYPQVRSSVWTPSLQFRNGLTWIIYLLGYEIFFRGFLLFAAMSFMSVTWAIAINLALYSAAHFHKGWKESVMAIPFGFLLCVITLFTGSIWAAFFIHASLALSSDWFAIKTLTNQSKNVARL